MGTEAGGGVMGRPALLWTRRGLLTLPDDCTWVVEAWGALWEAQVALGALRDGCGKDTDCWCGETGLAMGEHEPWCLNTRAVLGIR